MDTGARPGHPALVHEAHVRSSSLTLFLEQAGLSSPATLSWIGSLAFACIAFLAFLNARVIRLLGARHSAFLGIFTMPFLPLLTRE